MPEGGLQEGGWRRVCRCSSSLSFSSSSSCSVVPGGARVPSMMLFDQDCLPPRPTLQRALEIALPLPCLRCQNDGRPRQPLEALLHHHHPTGLAPLPQGARAHASSSQLIFRALYPPGAQAIVPAPGPRHDLKLAKFYSAVVSRATADRSIHRISHAPPAGNDVMSCGISTDFLAVRRRRRHGFAAVATTLHPDGRGRERARTVCDRDCQTCTAVRRPSSLTGA